MKTLFISHGGPDIVFSQDAAANAIRAMPLQREKPSAIVVVSAHWIDDPIGITASNGELDTIHDFGGFPDELYALRYAARGNASLSQQIHQLLQAANIESELKQHRGLDHGAWIPLSMMYPDAEIPVVQVSLPASSLGDVARIGEALASLREQHILMIGSGGSVHNLRAIRHNGNTEDWVTEFEDWLLQSIEGNQFDKLVTQEQFPASFRMAHPTIEHYAPLVFAWAAADKRKPGKRIHHSIEYSNLGMSMFEFG